MFFLMDGTRSDRVVVRETRDADSTRIGIIRLSTDDDLPENWSTAQRLELRVGTLELEIPKYFRDRVSELRGSPK